MANINWTARWKAWFGVLLGAALLVMAFVLYSRRDTIPKVQVIRVTRAALNAYLNSNGKVEPIDAHIFRAQFETFVTAISAREGQTVRRGQTILTLDASEIRAELARARIDLLRAQNDLRNARAGGPPDEGAQLTGDLRRAQVDVERLQKRQVALDELLGDHASTQDEVSQNAAGLAGARAQLDTLEKKQKDLARRAKLEEESASLRSQQAEERIRSLESKLRSATAISVADGTIYSFPLHAGDFVRAGDVLAEAADLHRVRVRAFIDETDLGGVKLDQPVKITWDAVPSKSWTGRTEQIPQQVVTRGMRSVGDVLCSVDNDKLELLPNVNVDVQILVRESHNSLVVPRGAIHREQERYFTFVLNGNHLHRREVSLGNANSASYEVLSGLEEGDRVALSSNLDLHDDMVVRQDEPK